MSDPNDRFDEYEGLDLTSEPPASKADNPSDNLSAGSASAGNAGGGLTHVQVQFRCCKVFWRFPIPANVLSGTKASWFVYCPRCGSQLQLP